MRPDVDVAALTSLNSEDQIVEALGASCVFVHKAVDTLTPTTHFRACVRPRGGTPRFNLLLQG
jgi:hypothetical protein